MLILSRITSSAATTAESFFNTFAIIVFSRVRHWYVAAFRTRAPTSHFRLKVSISSLISFPPPPNWQRHTVVPQEVVPQQHKSALDNVDWYYGRRGSDTLALKG